MANGIIEFSSDEEAILYKDIFSGKINLFNLPVTLYRRIAKELTTTVFKAFNITEDTNLQHPDFATPRALKRNLYDFSAAKDFQQIRDMQNFIFNEKGFKRSFDEFEAKAKTIFDTYNRDWLQAEFETSARFAENAAEWNQFQEEKDVFPLLKYNTLEDNRVRQTHKTLNDIVKPVDDPFWDTYLPPNGWRCRCFIQQLSEGDEPETDLKEKDIEPIDGLFKINPGKKQTIFQETGNNKHPYFEVGSRFNEHKQRNFGLPLPNDIIDVPKTRNVVRPSGVEPEFIPAKTVKEANEYFKSIMSEKGGVNVGRVLINKKLDVDGLNKRNNHLNKLLNEYEAPTIYKKANPNFKSTISYSSNKSEYGALTVNKTGDKISRVNFGHQNARNSILSPSEYRRLHKRNIVSVTIDADQIELATLTHEFAHFTSLTQSLDSKFATKKLSNFWNEIKNVRTEYYSELSKIKSNQLKIDEIYLGKYANTNANEFLAESFTQYKLNKKPTKYALKVGKIFDKYYKK